MNLSTEKLKELLVGPGHIAEADFEIVRKEAKQKNSPVEQFLTEKV